MKKFTIIIIFLICILLINGCNKEIINNNETISDRKQNIIDLVKQELINKDYIDINNLKSFNVSKVYLDGYYTNDNNKKYLEIDFSYICKDNSKECVKEFNIDDKGNSIVWIYTNYDETEIYEISNGISINYDDMNNGNYIRKGEIIE